MPTWSAIAYGALVTALLTAGGAAVFGGERRVRVAAAIAGTCGLSIIGWNAVLRSTEALGFADEATPLPLSWKAAGSAVVAACAVMLMLGSGPKRADRASGVVLVAMLAAVAAFAVDMYLY